MVEANPENKQSGNPSSDPKQTQPLSEEEKLISTGDSQSPLNQFTIDASKTRLLTNLELIRKADEYVDKLKLEKAVSLLDEGI